MSNCCTQGACACPSVCPCRKVFWLPRIALGLVFLAYGVSHYRFLGGEQGFMAMAQSVFAKDSVLAMIAGYLAYVVPALMIVGGVLFAVGQLKCISKVCIVAALSGIIGWASVAVMVGDASMTGSLMPMIQNAAILFLFYGMVKKMGCCSAMPSCK